MVLRALGPSLAAAGIRSVVADPVLHLLDASGAPVASNDSWRAADADTLQLSGFAPADDREAALVQTLNPGAYTAHVTGGSGVALLEIYDIGSASPSRLANISSRGFVGRDDDVMIGGFIVRGTEADARLVVRALGPSLAANGIAQPLDDPAIEVRDGNGLLVAANDSWRATQEAEISALSIAPADEREAAVVTTVPPGAYTAVVRGADGGTGVALLEIYRLP